MQIEEIHEIIRKLSLANAVEHGGRARAGSVLGALIAQQPDLRNRLNEVRQIIEKIVEEVNRLSVEEQKAELLRFGPIERKKKEEKRELPELKIEKELVVRFAPNPDGALHLGNARPALLCDEYAKKYKGKFILRFDDTDPKVKVPEKQFYDWIREDLRWLGIKWHKEIIASKRLKIYYKYAKELITKGGAYVCTCRPEVWRTLRNKGVACDCRSLSVRDNLKRWKGMLDHVYKEGEAVLRVKTDLAHPNPAVRDWPAMRIVDEPKHPLVRTHLWPLYNFASAIDDALLGTTHIFRGQEHATNSEKQRFVYDYFGWKYPEVIILGRFLMPEMVLSKSLIREGIKNRTYESWADPRLGTLRALRRRGFSPEALRALVLDIGVTSSDSTIAFENLAGYNKKFIDKIAKRYFFVAEPVKVKIKQLPVKKVRLPLHPEKKVGWRRFDVGDVLLIERHDLERFAEKEVRLIGLCNIILKNTCIVTGTELKHVQKIHWVPAAESIKVRVIMPERNIDGVGERALLRTKPGEVVQFERFGFVRIEKKTKDGIVAVFGHNGYRH
jgi:glutamyl-tRNA synthetase